MTKRRRRTTRFYGLSRNHDDDDDQSPDHIWHIKWLCNQLLSRGQCNTFDRLASRPTNGGGREEMEILKELGGETRPRWTDRRIRLKVIHYLFVVFVSLA